MFGEITNDAAENILVFVSWCPSTRISVRDPSRSGIPGARDMLTLSFFPFFFFGHAVRHAGS